MSARGRRPGDEDTRRAILDQARRLFAEQGYERASLRAIARAAGVDPSLIAHYFGSKQGLLTAALELPVDPTVVLAPVLAGPREDAGERLVRAIVAVWEVPAVNERLMGMLRTAASHDLAREVLRSALHNAFAPIVAELVDDQPQVRTGLVMSQMGGLAFTRYFLQLPEVTALDADVLAATVGATIQRYLTAPLPVTRTTP
jgi:AcrR family transcriptional regulator